MVTTPLNQLAAAGGEGGGGEEESSNTSSSTSHPRRSSRKPTTNKGGDSYEYHHPTIQRRMSRGLTCVACRKSKTKCDGLYPCARCVFVVSDTVCVCIGVSLFLCGGSTIQSKRAQIWKKRVSCIKHKAGHMLPTLFLLVLFPFPLV